MPKDLFVLEAITKRYEFEMKSRIGPRASVIDNNSHRTYYFNPMTDSVRMHWKDITDFNNNIHLLQEFNNALILLKNRFLNMKAFW